MVFYLETYFAQAEGVFFCFWGSGGCAVLLEAGSVRMIDKNPGDEYVGVRVLAGYGCYIVPRGEIGGWSGIFGRTYYYRT